MGICTSRLNRRKESEHRRKTRKSEFSENDEHENLLQESSNQRAPTRLDTNTDCNTNNADELASQSQSTKQDDCDKLVFSSSMTPRVSNLYDDESIAFSLWHTDTKQPTTSNKYCLNQTGCGFCGNQCFAFHLSLNPQLSDLSHTKRWNYSKTVHFLASGYTRDLYVANYQQHYGQSDRRGMSISSNIVAHSVNYVLIYSHVMAYLGANEVNEVNKNFGSQILEEHEMKCVIKLFHARFRLSYISPVICFELLYRGSRDGFFKFREFHRLCDGRGPTFTIMITKSGNILGGFTSIPWSSHFGYIYDEKAFLCLIRDFFDKRQSMLDTPLLSYEIRNKSAANIIHDPAKGPVFGSGPDISIENDCNNKRVNCLNSLSFDLIKLIGNEDNKFQVQDMEVYQVFGI